MVIEYKREREVTQSTLGELETEWQGLSGCWTCGPRWTNGAPEVRDGKARAERRQGLQEKEQDTSVCHRGKMDERRAYYTE